MRLVSLQEKKKNKPSFSLSLREPSDMAICLQTRKMTCTRTPPCKHPDLGLLASRTVRNQYLLFKPSSLQYSLIATGTNSDERWLGDKNRLYKNKRIRVTIVRVVNNSGFSL